MKRFAFAVAAIFSVISPATAQRPLDLDTFVPAVMREFDVPGIAVSIVKDGQVVVAKGYGVRSIDDTGRVNEHTRFGIASNTKLFTATALMMLAEQRKLVLDSPVIRYLPWFQMSNPDVTRQMTVRDLLVHRSGLGLGAGDLLWWPQTNYLRSDIVRRLKYVPITKPFRKEYAYDNVLYTVAGEVIRVVSSNMWEQFVDHDILRRIGMTDSRVQHSNAIDSGNVARTHAKVDGILTRVQPMTGNNTNPAGGINASAIDMTKWLMVQLDSGRLADGSRLFHPSTTRELWTLVTPIPFQSANTALDRRTTNGYALGLNVRDYRGIPILLHTGSLPGYASRVLMIPSLRLGISVLTNAESVEAHDAIAFHIADHYLGANDVDHLKEFAARAKREGAKAAEVERKAVVSRDSTKRPSLVLAKYARTYNDRWYGDVVVTQDDSQHLGIRFTRTPALIGTLEHWEGDTFVARWRDRSLRADAYVTFHIAKDSVESVKMRPVSPLTDFSYDFQDLDLRPTRAPAKKKAARRDRAAFQQPRITLLRLYDAAS